MCFVSPRRLAHWLLVAFIAGCQSSAPQPAPKMSRDTQISRFNDRVEIISKVYHIDKIYPSMTGPWSQIKVPLLDTKTPELVWITGTEVQMLNADATTRMPDEFMCHANLDLKGAEHCEQLGLKKYLDGRIFTLSQGQLDVKFPNGMGIPIRSDYPLDLVTQALNLNLKDANLDVRHRVTIHFVRDRDLKQPMKPLYESGVSTQVTLEDRPIAFDIKDYGLGSKIMGMCIPAQKAQGGVVQEDKYGQHFTGHWMVPPGRQVARTRCTSIMNVPADTKIYSIGVHLHPYAESLELKDVTENHTLFRSTVRNFQDKIGLESVDTFENEAGIPVYKHHEYEIISTYNNPTDKPIDSMAVLYLYLEDQEFNREEALKRIAATPQLADKNVKNANNSKMPRM